MSKNQDSWIEVNPNEKEGLKFLLSNYFPYSGVLRVTENKNKYGVNYICINTDASTLGYIREMAEQMGGTSKANRLELPKSNVDLLSKMEVKLDELVGKQSFIEECPRRYIFRPGYLDLISEIILSVKISKREIDRDWEHWNHENKTKAVKAFIKGTWDNKNPTQYLRYYNILGNGNLKSDDLDKHFRTLNWNYCEESETLEVYMNIFYNIDVEFLKVLGDCEDEIPPVIRATEETPLKNFGKKTNNTKKVRRKKRNKNNKKK